MCLQVDGRCVYIYTLIRWAGLVSLLFYIAVECSISVNRVCPIICRVAMYVYQYIVLSRVYGDRWTLCLVYMLIK